ncbi:MAG: DUF5686 family protein [Gemmatimonadota bacterium]|nr:DUF5686 family protein [Gemmatimonadota bacterium]
MRPDSEGFITTPGCRFFRIGANLLAGFFALHLVPAPANPATLTGTVRDSATRAPLPYATVVLPELRRGDLTDLYGRFAVSGLPSGRVGMRVSYVGYGTALREIVLPDTAERGPEILLSPTPMTLKSHVTMPRPSLETLLEEIGREPRENVFHTRYTDLKSHRFALGGTQTLYTDSRTGPHVMAQIDYDGTGFYRNPGKIVQDITAYRSRHAPAQQFGMHPGVIVNIRSGRLNGRDFDVGPLPLESDARKDYRYRLVSTVQMGDVAVYKIHVEPRKRRRPGLVGAIWISANDFSLVGYDLRLNKKGRRPLGIKELRAYQQNALYYERYWLPVLQTVRIRTDSGALAEQTTRIGGYTLNPALEDSLFNRDAFSIRPDATRRGAAYWKARDDSLEISKRRAVQMLLETNTVPQGWKRLLSQ